MPIAPSVQVNVSGARGPLGIEVEGTPVAGDFLVKAAGGSRKYTTASGTGADAGLRTDLAASGGSALAGFVQAGTGAEVRSVQTELREARTAFTQYGAATNIVTADNEAIAAIGSSIARNLYFPAGSWTIESNVDWSAYRNVTFVMEPGCVINQGTNTVTLPERVMVGLGSRFSGSGLVTSVNDARDSLATPPGEYTEYGNDARGLGALSLISGGVNNLAWGVNALGSAQYVRSSYAFGYDALSSVVGDQTGVAAEGTFYALGDSNFAFGDFTLRDNEGGYENIAFGNYTLRNNVNGNWNIGIGHQSQITGTGGDCNVSLGHYTLTKITSDNNLAIGWAALEVAVTGSNCAVGHVSQNASVDASRNTSLGPLTLQFNKSGNDNVAIGQESLKNMVDGDQNTACGGFALGQVTAPRVNNSAFGFNSLLGLMTADNCTGLGAGALSTNTGYSNCTGVGVGTSVTGDNQVQLGSATTAPYAYAALQIRSDARDKRDVRDTKLGLDFINALRPVDFRWDMREDYRKSAPSRDAPDYSEKLAEWIEESRLGNIKTSGAHKRKRYHNGLIAQELKDAMDKLGVDCSAYQDHSINGGEDVLTISYDGLIAPLIKAVQELSLQNAHLSDRIKKLEFG